MHLVQRSYLPIRPITLIGIMHAIHAIPEGVVQIDILVSIAKLSVPIAHYVRHAGMNARKDGYVGGHHQQTARRDGNGGEGIIDTVAEAPTSHIHGRGPRVQQFEIFLADVLRRRMVMDFVNHNRPGIDGHSEQEGENGKFFHRMFIRKNRREVKIVVRTYG